MKEQKSNTPQLECNKGSEILVNFNASNGFL